MAIVRDIAVVLRRFEYSETSQVLVLFTRAHGKVRALAKGMKRSTRQRFAAAVDVLDVGAVALTERRSSADGLSTLTEWKQQRCCGGLRERLDRIYAGQYAAEVTAMLTEDWDAHPALFDALAGLLFRLNDAAGVLDLVVGYQCTLLNEVGLWPRFDACVLCGRRGDLTTFSALEGGAVCRHCEPAQIEKRLVPVDVIRCLAGWSAAIGPPPALSPDARAFDVLDYHLSHAAGRPPSMGRLLKAHFVQH